MRYTIVRMFNEASRRGLAVDDPFIPDNPASANALMQAGMLRAHADPEGKRTTLRLPSKQDNPNVVRPPARFKR